MTGLAELAAFAAAAALAAMLFASRLPPGPAFLLPRRGSYGLYEAAWRLFGRPHGPALFSALIAAVLIAAAAALALALRRAHPKRLPAAWRERASLLTGPLFAALLAIFALARVLDLIQLVWFPYGAMDVREPLAVFASAALALVPAAAAARAWVAGRRRLSAGLLIALAALAGALGAFGSANGVGRSLVLPDARGKTLYVVLTEGTRGPARDVYALAPDVFEDSDPRPALLALASGPRDARRLPALRALYEEEEKRWDPAGLRGALLLGVRQGDELAASLLLAHLCSVAPSTGALAALGSVSDETAWRIGPLAAAELSRAYAHQGDAAAASFWAAKAGGPEGVALGLLGPPPKEGPGTGRISGTLRAPERFRAALYRRTDPDAPYLLDAAGLVASAEPDRKGRFTFSGLTPGRYYLAFALSAGDGSRGEVSVSGNSGDLLLAAGRPALDLPPLTLSFSRR